MTRGIYLRYIDLGMGRLDRWMGSISMGVEGERVRHAGLAAGGWVSLEGRPHARVQFLNLSTFNRPAIVPSLVGECQQGGSAGFMPVTITLSLAPRRLKGLVVSMVDDACALLGLAR
jgi:hypothetical protein